MSNCQKKILWNFLNLRKKIWEKLTQKRLRLGIVGIENGRGNKRHANHAERDEEEEQTGLDDARLDALLVARQTDRLDE